MISPVSWSLLTAIFWKPELPPAADPVLRIDGFDELLKAIASSSSSLSPPYIFMMLIPQSWQYREVSSPGTV